MKRKHQIETETIFRKIAKGGIRDKFILCSVEPGGGKSALPIIAGKELIFRRKADYICWVVPRKSLQDQGERSFEDPFFRHLFSHFLSIRSSTNEIDPCRDQHGFITTYQAVGMDRAGLIKNVFRKNRIILVLDEFHHVEEGGTWHKSLAPLVELAEYVLLMTGTLGRGDGKPIAFAPYREYGDGVVIDLEKPGYQVVEYNRSDALEEKAILPLVFHLADASASWVDDKGRTTEINSLAHALKKDAGAAIFTALNTEFAETLLEKGISHWLEHRTRVPHAKHLVVTANYEAAKKHTKMLRSKGFNVEIATSHDSPAAHEAILKYKRSEIDILVSIAMAYEGLDVPEISHITCLTNIRSVFWIIQMMARAVRIDKNAGPYESQAGYIFAPDDVLFRKIVDQIKAEQFEVARREEEKAPSKKKKPGDQLGLFGTSGPFGIKPKESKFTGAREFDLDRALSGISHHKQQVTLPVARVQTKSEKEKALRQKIDQHVKRFEFVNCYNYGSINTELKQKYGKGRADMTLSELEMVWRFVQQAYPVSRAANYTKPEGVKKGPRGYGRKAPAKAQEWTGPVNIPVFGGR